MKVVKDFEIKKGMKVEELINQFEEAGAFNAKHLAQAVKILKEMFEEKEVLKFLSFTANLVATGLRGIFRDFLKEKMFDVVITTCGTLDHDLARSFKEYYHGSFYVNDEELRKKGICRLGNIFIPNESYGMIIEKKMKEFLESLEKKEFSTYELCWELGKFIGKEDSLLYWAYKNQIPVIVPGITDGAIGYQIWQYSQDHEIKINLLKDEKLLSDLIWNAKKSGALIIGGGISKHHVIWWNQFKNGLDYVVYISTAIESDGSLSGARPREAISWGKINKKAKKVFIQADATIVLPLLYACII